MVRVPGLDPVRQRHTPLKRACLPVPAHSQIYLIIYFSAINVNIKLASWR